MGRPLGAPGDAELGATVTLALRSTSAEPLAAGASGLGGSTEQEAPEDEAESDREPLEPPLPLPDEDDGKAGAAPVGAPPGSRPLLTPASASSGGGHHVGLGVPSSAGSCVTAPSIWTSSGSGWLSSSSSSQSSSSAMFSPSLSRASSGMAGATASARGRLAAHELELDEELDRGRPRDGGRECNCLLPAWCS